MLPALPSPFPLRRGLVAVALVLALAVGGCAAAAQPPRGVLLDALALQIRLTQGSIATALGLEEVGLPQVSRVRVEELDALRIAGAPGLRLAGRFDWRLASDPIRVDSPFELFLQRGERGQSWRLARPVGGTEGEGGSQQEWLLDPLPLPGERSRA
jgi:hypothetical protein